MIYNIPTLLSYSNNRVQLSLQLTYELVLDLIRNETIGVNEEAQRSINPTGIIRLSTTDIIRMRKLGQAKRIKEYSGFIDHNILEPLQDDLEGVLAAGFSGTIQLTCSGNTEGIKFKETIFPPGNCFKTEEITHSLGLTQDALGEHQVKLGLLCLNPSDGKTLLYIVDGQGRLLVWFHIQVEIEEKIVKTKEKILKLNRSGKDDEEEQAELTKLEARRELIRKYLKTNTVSMLITGSSVRDDSVVLGISTDLERQAYIEGNQLNSQASVEEALLWDGSKLVLNSLRTMRTNSGTNSWLSAEAIESERKSIGKNSLKVFTNSGLAQAFTFSVTGKKNALKLSAKDELKVSEHEAFVWEYWSEVGKVFSDHWFPESMQGNENEDTLRKYLDERRFVSRDASFQGLFIQALGRLGYYLGEKFDWKVDKFKSYSLETLSPNRDGFNYEAKPSGSKEWNSTFLEISSGSDRENRSYQNMDGNIKWMLRFLLDRLGETRPQSEEPQRGKADNQTEEGIQ